MAGASWSRLAVCFGLLRLCACFGVFLLFKVYLQDEERRERRERAQLAAAGRCNPGADGKGRAAALGPCEDNAVEREAAEKVGGGGSSLSSE